MAALSSTYVQGGAVLSSTAWTRGRHHKKLTSIRKNCMANNFSDSFPEPVVLPIADELDLHTFSPREVEPLLEDYLESCREHGIYQVKIIHGKGTGQLKARVRSLLSRNPLVLHLADAEADSGGWGATIVRLKQGNRE
jgi:dsDNA-specific endonuclease/ATPase MutS2